LTLFSARNKFTKMTNDNVNQKPKTTQLTCKLTTPELQQFKSTVIESLRKQVIQTKELTNGFAFKFPGTDKMLNELTEYIKTERKCCNFFTFNLSIGSDQSEIGLELIGAEGTKDFLKTELGF
jgi:hypothetical protein